MKKRVLNLSNRILSKFGYQIQRKKTGSRYRSEHVHDPQYSYMAAAQLQDQLLQDLAAISEPFFAANFPGLAAAGAGSFSSLKDFFQTYQNRPLWDNTGGSGFHNAFWLYLFTAALQPELIIESGVWKGHTTWLFRQAAPTARILGFDINLKHLEFTDPSITYHEQDWSTSQLPGIDPERSLVFFDCHVNHARRIIESHNAGFKHLIFDDNPPLSRLYSYGQPGFPSARMLLDLSSLSEDPQHWFWKGEARTATLDLEEAQKASLLIKKHIVFPDVGGPTRYGGFSFLTYVQI